jgi:hypothetical protein
VYRLHSPGRPNMQLDAHGDHHSIANCRTKIPAIFEEYVEFFVVFKKVLCIHSTVFRGTLIGKH